MYRHKHSPKGFPAQKHEREIQAEGSGGAPALLEPLDGLLEGTLQLRGGLAVRTR